MFVIIRMSAEDFTAAMEGKREFRRLQQQNIDLKQPQPQHLSC